MTRTRKILLGLLGLVVVVLAGSFAYTRLADAPDAFDRDDLEQRLDSETTAADSTPDTAADTAPDSTPDTAPADTEVAPSGSLDGTWVVAEGSEVGYRVEETINGFAVTANGRTSEVTGSLLISGTTVTEGSFSVDMATVASDESRRDGQFRGRIMAVDQFPTAEFVLTSPIEFGSPDATSATATGDLTLRGVTRSVTVEVTTSRRDGRIGVLGQVPVVFADFGIPNPSFASIVTEDDGVLEFVLVLEPA